MASENKKKPTADKRMLQNIKRRTFNNISKAKVKRSIKALEAIQSKATPENLPALAEEKQLALQKAQKNIDKASKTGAIPKGRANRLKSRLSKRVDNFKKK